MRHYWSLGPIKIELKKNTLYSIRPSCLALYLGKIQTNKNGFNDPTNAN